MARWTGLEPATSAVTGRHSNQLNYHRTMNAEKRGVPSWIRTKGHLLKREMLYQLS